MAVIGAVLGDIAGSQFEFNIQIKLEQLGHTVLLHGNAVKHIRGFHCAAAVGDDDELGLVAHPA